MRSLVAIVKGLGSFLVGMWVTFVNAVRSPVTFQYPERYYTPLRGFRGHPALVTDSETGAIRCTACLMCAKSCPLGIIDIRVGQREDKKRYPISWQVDLGRCMVCNLCVEACPFGALEMSPEYELAEDRVGNLVYGLERLKLPPEGFDVLDLDGKVTRTTFPGGDRK